MSPAASILVVDYWLIRKQMWNVPELYLPHGIYWFWHGLNWRAFAAYFLGMWPAVPGFCYAVSVGGVSVNTAWQRFFQISYFFGYIVSGALYYLFNKLSPPPGLGVQVNFDIDGHIVEMMDSTSETSEPHHSKMAEKTADATESNV